MSATTLEALAHLSRLLYTHSTVLDVLSLRVAPVELVAAGLAFLEDFDYAGVGKRMFHCPFETYELAWYARRSSIGDGPIRRRFTLGPVAHCPLRGIFALFQT